MADDTKRAIMMGTCPVEIKKHLAFHSDWHDAYPKVKTAIRDCGANAA